MRIALAALFLTAIAAGAAVGGTRETAPPCGSGSLAARFTRVPGSGSAGHIVYALRVRNVSTQDCFVSGLPRLQLLGRTGKRLPTHARAVNPGALTAVRVLLHPGSSAIARASFSPDVPGPTEQHPGLCEPKAYRLQAAIPPGSAVATGPVVPATSVCQNGAMLVTALSAAR